MRIVLEFLRIIFIFILLGGLGWAIIENAYQTNVANEKYSWLGGIAILLLLFVLYRNKLQFSGWYKGEEEDRVKLPKKVSRTMIACSIVLMIMPFVLGTILG